MPEASQMDVGSTLELSLWSIEGATFPFNHKSLTWLDMLNQVGIPNAINAFVLLDMRRFWKKERGACRDAIDQREKSSRERSVTICIPLGLNKR
ncbi:hypothetical protein AVEN_69504-1 [Araneus ventricosus]|uniref:Uncharacterized protein n=1 Tax=Araneus ventricosus TaxID=182803 RepID=A0A4Y2QYP4_ARAVE|nr:hypothetical protein AVEN_69504-1 [Araneus ventricosus]